MKKLLSILLSICLLFTATALAQDAQPPQKPEGTPPAGGVPTDGQPPEMPSGGPDGNPPDGAPGGGPGGPGGGSSQPASYAAVYPLSQDTDLAGEAIASTGTDENALLVTGGAVTLTDSTVTRDSDDSTGGDSASFYGVGAALLATGGRLTVSGTQISTDAKGGAGVFAYGDGVVTISDSTIDTLQDTSGGIHVAGGGTLYANNLTVTTRGESSAAIRSDRGGGIMVVNGGSYTTGGSGSPAVYVTADITVTDAALTATGSEALCLEGLNSVTLTNCDLTGNLPDLSQNDNTWTVILYQSMSGDSQVGKGAFTMTGGSLTSLNGGLFYTTNTESQFTLNNVALTAAEDCEYLLRCTGNRNQRGWGQSGANGADCTFTAIQQKMDGLVIWDSISTLSLSLTDGTVFTGAVVDDETCAGAGGDGTCSLTVDETSTWIVNGDSTLTSLIWRGTIQDEAGRAVTVQDSAGSVLFQGESDYVITVSTLD